MTETPEMAEEDIAKDVLDNICNMSGVEKNIQVRNLSTRNWQLVWYYFQAQNIFLIDGQKTVVRISNRGITFHYKRKISCFKLEPRLVTGKEIFSIFDQ